MSADNFHFDITGAKLFDCLNIAFLGSPSGKATHWIVEEKEGNPQRLLLGWNKDKDMTPFPAPMSVEECEPFILSWLRTVDYRKELDHDGDNSKGWRIYNESWGKINGYTYSFVAIEPIWLIYGK